jgi:hypothetical protein
MLLYFSSHFKLLLFLQGDMLCIVFPPHAFVSIFRISPKTIVSDKAILTSTDPCFRYYVKMRRKGQKYTIIKKKIKECGIIIITEKCFFCHVEKC